MNMPLALLNRRRRIGGFSPNALFALAEPGVWFDPSDLTTLFQDTAGTTPVTMTGQSVGLMLDKSKGLVLGSELVTNGDFASGASWTAGAGWTISGGVATKVAGTSANIDQSLALTAGRSYQVTYTITSISVSGAFIRLAGATTVDGVTRSTVGTFTEIVVAPASMTTLSLRAQSTTNVTVDNISVKELPGNHAVQATTANRPIYGIHPFGGRRNLLERTEEFDNAYWTKTAATVSGDTLTENTANAEHRLLRTLTSVIGVQNTLSFDMKAGAGGRNVYAYQLNGGNGWTVVVNPATGAIVSSATIGSGVGSASVAALPDNWFRVSIVLTMSSTAHAISIGMSDGTSGIYLGNGTSTIRVRNAQLETGSTATAYQRVTDQYNVTEAGVSSVSYLFFDGVNDSLATSTITPGVDKAQVFAGVRKLSDSAIRIVLETGTTGGNSSITLAAPRTSTVSYAFTSRGSSEGDARTGANTFVAPITNVLTGIGDIAGDNALVRVNGVQAGQSTADQGTGNYAAAAIYIGARNNAEFFFSGRLYSLVARFGPNLDTGQISSTETWVAGKTGITI